MIRELVLVSGDLAAAPWFSRGIPPSPPTPEGLTIETLSASGSPHQFNDGPVPLAQAVRRLAEGDTCLVAVTSGGVMAAQMWCSERSRFIGWNGRHNCSPGGA